MIQITVPECEIYDSKQNLFQTLKEQTISLEHSLLSISKWESKFKKPFLSREKRTSEEAIYYLKCMCITPNVSDIVFRCIPTSEIEKISEYIEDQKTATSFSNSTSSRNQGVLTSEVIYYLMISYGIPFECQKWHLSRLITLIRVCQEKNGQSKKMSKQEILARNRELNAKRRAAIGSKG